MKQYALYKGDAFLGIGTAEELTALIGVKADTIRWYATPSARRGNMIAEVI